MDLSHFLLAVNPNFSYKPTSEKGPHETHDQDHIHARKTDLKIHLNKIIHFQRLVSRLVVRW